MEIDQNQNSPPRGKEKFLGRFLPGNEEPRTRRTRSHYTYSPINLTYSGVRGGRPGTYTSSPPSPPVVDIYLSLPLPFGRSFPIDPSY